MRTVFVFAVALILIACPGPSPDSTGGSASSDELTRRQKDSIISTLPIPGASAVGRALDAADAARVRALAHDTIS